MERSINMQTLLSKNERDYLLVKEFKQASKLLQVHNKPTPLLREIWDPCWRITPQSSLHQSLKLGKVFSSLTKSSKCHTLKQVWLRPTRWAPFIRSRRKTVKFIWWDRSTQIPHIIILCLQIHEFKFIDQKSILSKYYNFKFLFPSKKLIIF